MFKVGILAWIEKMLSLKAQRGNPVRILFIDIPPYINKRNYIAGKLNRANLNRHSHSKGGKAIAVQALRLLHKE
jgi:hypothetical protein